MMTQTLARADSRWRFAGLACLCALLTTAGAYVQIPLPFTPVPLSLQSFAVLLGAGLVGPEAAIAGELAYLTAGFFGLPVFASGTIMTSLGYLLAFPLAAALVGFGLRRAQTLAATVAIVAAGSMGILALGSLWLSVYLHISLTGAMRLGLYPFLAGDALKVAGVSMTLRSLRRG